MRKSFTFFSASVITGLGATACTQDTSTLLSQSSEALTAVEPVVLYKFAETAPPAVKDAAPPEQVAACALDCVAAAQADFGACTAEAYRADQVSACRALVHDRATACAQAACSPEPEVVTGDACTVACMAEAEQATTRCLADGDRCLTEGNDVFATCFANECLTRGPITRRLDQKIVLALKDERPEPVAAETVDQPPDCHLACQQYDLSVYLECVGDRPDDQGSCRNSIGAAYDFCVESHCPAQ